MNDKHVLIDGVTIHTHACGEEGIFVNAYLIETAQGVVAVDSTLSVSTAQAFRARLDALVKPLLAVLVTHPHPDHVAGLAVLVDDDSTPIYATGAARTLMQVLEAPKRAQWAPTYGAQWVMEWRYPNRTMPDAESLEIDGIRYTVHDLGRGGDCDCDANAIWLAQPMQAASAPVAFLSDLIFNGIHSYMADGGVLAWLANLERASALSSQCDLAFPGHGEAGAPAALIDRQRRYLLHYVSQLQQLSVGGALTDDIRSQLTEAMKAYLPDAGLEFLIGYSADAVLAELRGAAT